MWFLTHPEVALDPRTPVPHWSLNDVGRRRAAGLAGAPFLDNVTSLWSSTETKAIHTASLFAGALPLYTRDDLGEHDRSATGFLPPAQFGPLVEAFFARPDDSAGGWTPARHEQRRIVAAVDAVLADDRAGDGDLVIVSHGGVGTLLLCHLLGHHIDRRLDQPGQGHAFAFDRDDRGLRRTWMTLEDVADLPTSSAEQG